MSSTCPSGNLPSNTFLKLGLLVLISLKHCSRCACSKGVSFACENVCPASLRQAFSSACFVENSWWDPSWVGPITACSAPVRPLGFSTAWTKQAVFLACSVAWCCFHRDLAVVPFACAWAWIRLAIHVSRQLGSALNDEMFCHLTPNYPVCHLGTAPVEPDPTTCQPLYPS